MRSTKYKLLGLIVALSCATPHSVSAELPRLVDGGLAALDLRTGLFGRIGIFHLDDRPASEDRFPIEEGFTRVDATVGWERERFRLSIEVRNLLAANWKQPGLPTIDQLGAEFETTSCPGGTSPVVGNGELLGCEDDHTAPAVMGSFTVRF